MTTTVDNNTVSFNEFANTPELFVGTESYGQLHRDYNFCNLLLNQVTATGGFFQSLRDDLERYRSLSAKQFKCVLNQLVKEGVDLVELLENKWVEVW